MATGPALWDLDCELLLVDEVEGSLVLDAVTVAPMTADDEELPAGSPVTWCLVNPTGGPGHLAGQFKKLVSSETGCRIGMVEWHGQQLLVASGSDDCVVVMLSPT
jgi:hypothetical protein